MSTNKTQHTATPWTVHPHASDLILDAETYICAKGQTHANAAYIVTAVNAHEKLVELAKEAAKLRQFERLTPTEAKLLIMAEAALALAGEG